MTTHIRLSIVLTILIVLPQANSYCQDSDQLHVWFEPVRDVPAELKVNWNSRNKKLEPATESGHFLCAKGGSFDVPFNKAGGVIELYCLQFRGEEILMPQFDFEFKPIPGSLVRVLYTMQADEVDPSVRLPKLVSVMQTKSLTFDKTLKSIETKKSSPIRASKDSPQRKSESYTIKYTVRILNGWKGEAEVKAGIKAGLDFNWASVEGTIATGIRASIERETERIYEESKTTTNEVTIPGDGEAYEVVWFDTFRTGTACILINGNEYSIPFEFREGWDLQARKITP